MQTDVQPVESSPTEPSLPEIPLNGSERNEWEMNGIPLNAPAAEPDKPKEAGTAVTTDPAPVIKQEDQKYKADTEARFNELREQRLKTHEENLSLKARIAELEKGVKPATPPAAEPAKPAVTDGAPDPEKYFGEGSTYPTFLEAQRAFAKDMGTFAAKQAIAEERAADAKAKADETAKAEYETRATAFRERVEKLNDPKFGERIAEVTAMMNEAKAVDMATAIFDSEVGPQLLLKLSENIQEAKRIMGMPPRLQAYKLGEMAATLGIPKENGTLPAKTKVSQAQAIGTTIPSNGTVAIDEAEAALKAGDVARYNEIMNRRDIAHAQGR